MKDIRATSTAETVPEAVLADLRALVAEAQRVLDASGKDSNGAAAGTLGERLEAARRRVNELYSGARDRVAAGRTYADERIRAHPYQAVAAAAGAGLVLGLLLGRRAR